MGTRVCRAGIQGQWETFNRVPENTQEELSSQAVWWNLDCMILEIFSNLNHGIILWYLSQKCSPGQGHLRENQVALRTQQPGLTQCLFAHGKPLKCSRVKLRLSVWPQNHLGGKEPQDHQVLSLTTSLSIRPEDWVPCPWQYLIGIRAITKAEKRISYILNGFMPT